MQTRTHISYLRYCGYSQAQIATRLGLSQQTISHHLRRIREKSEREGSMKVFMEGVEEIQGDKIAKEELKDALREFLENKYMENQVKGRRNFSDFYFGGGELDIKLRDGFPIISEKVWKEIEGDKEFQKMQEQYEEVLLLAKNQTEMIGKITEDLKKIKNQFEKMKREGDNDVGNNKSTC